MAALVDCENGNHWLRQAAEAGWGKAEFILFQYYFNEVAPCRGCPPYAMDKVEAIKWLHHAANHGFFRLNPLLL
jgi:TPR repeat protein